MIRKSTLILLFIFLFATSLDIQGQVGIGTTTPQNDLHIAGATSGIRVEGFSSANNINNTGSRNVAVYANANGDLIIPNTPAGAEIVVDEADIISSIPVDTGILGQANNTVLATTETFTLDQNAIIFINYNITFFCSQTDGVSPIDDGKAKLIRNFFEIKNDSGDVVERNGIMSQSYTNTASGDGGTFIAGLFTNTAAHMLILPPGTYTVDLYGTVAAVNGNLGVASDAFRATFGAGSSDSFKIIALF
ncbi:hypothetical protein [uncultured Dokdonia sp.]|uniref:hypothetical protein n=1 Tax=uncultured Dokdonia sp. TaxID=575653 RepID=UPI0026118281|nr:hypothetical protein [uncultured Dokdonia sp.]